MGWGMGVVDGDVFEWSRFGERNGDGIGQGMERKFVFVRCFSVVYNLELLDVEIENLKAQSTIFKIYTYY